MRLAYSTLVFGDLPHDVKVWSVRRVLPQRFTCVWGAREEFLERVRPV